MRFYRCSANIANFERWRRDEHGFVEAAFLFVRALFTARLVLSIENLALRQQLAVLQQSNKRPKKLA